MIQKKDTPNGEILSLSVGFTYQSDKVSIKPFITTLFIYTFCCRNLQPFYLEKNKFNFDFELNPLVCSIFETQPFAG